MKNSKNLVFLMSAFLVVSVSAMKENTASSTSSSSSAKALSCACLRVLLGIKSDFEFLKKMFCGPLSAVCSTRAAALTSGSCGVILSSQLEQVGVVSEEEQKACPLKRSNANLH